jgi:chromosome segregation ATPase
MIKRLLLLLSLVLYAVSPVLSQATERAELLPDGSVLLSPQTLRGIDATLTTLETNLTRQRELSTSLTGELRQAELSLTTLRSLYSEQSILAGSLAGELSRAASSLTTLTSLYNEQGLLVLSLQTQWSLIAERLQDSDESYAWIQQDMMEMEGELTAERKNSARLDKSARVWRKAAIVLGCLAIGGIVAAVVW